MKKVITFILIMLASFTIHAQQLSFGDYKVTISDTKDFITSGKIEGVKYEHQNTEGKYKIEKERKKIASQRFTLTESIGYRHISVLNIRVDEISGNSITYDHKTNLIEFSGEEYTPEKTSNKEDIILSCLLIYAQWLEPSKSETKKKYYSSGELKEIGELIYGKKNGEWKYYYENGQLESIGKFTDSKQNGEWKYYYANGQLKQIGNWANSKATGEWRFYNEKGELTKKEIY